MLKKRKEKKEKRKKKVRRMSICFFFFEKIVWFGSKTMFKRIRERWEGSKEKKLETGKFL